MPLPLLLIAKAGHTARSVLKEWSKLDPEVRRHLTREADDVRRSMIKLARAAGARRRGDGRELSWSEARRMALDPSPEFVVAQQVVAAVRAAGELDEGALRSRLGGRDGLKEGLAIAEAETFVERCGRKRWRITGTADHVLSDAPEAQFVESAIVEHVALVGIAGREELALGVGAPDTADPPLLAGLERAVASGAVEWLAPGLFGLPRDRLAAFPEPAQPQERQSEGEIKALLSELKREIDELRKAVQRARAGELPPPPSPVTDQASYLAAAFASPHGAAPQAAAGPLFPPAPAAGPPPPPPTPAPAQPDPFEVLERLRQARDGGLITAEEYEGKKAEVLARL